MKPKLSREAAIRETLSSLNAGMVQAVRQIRLLTDLLEQPAEFDLEGKVRAAWERDQGSAVSRIVSKIGAEAFLRAVIDGDRRKLESVSGVGPAISEKLVREDSAETALEIMRRRDTFNAAVR